MLGQLLRFRLVIFYLFIYFLEKIVALGVHMLMDLLVSGTPGSDCESQGRGNQSRHAGRGWALTTLAAHPVLPGMAHSGDLPRLESHFRVELIAAPSNQ